MLKLIHAADFHLDAPFAALPPERAAERREEQRQLLTRLAELAEAERADLVLLSGDLLDSDQARHETVQALARALGEIKVPVFIAPGNHDFWSARSPWSAGAWPENVHIFSCSTLETVELPELNCAVHGAAFIAPSCDQSPLKGFSAPEDGKIHLMALHGDVDGRGRYGSIDRADIAASGLDYLALIAAAVVNGVKLAGRRCQRHSQSAAFAAGALVGAAAVAVAAAAGQQSDRHHTGEGQCENLFHRSFLSYSL